VGSGRGWLGTVVAQNFPLASLAGRGRCTASKQLGATGGAHQLAAF